MWFCVRVIFLLTMIRSMQGGALKDTELGSIKELLSRYLDFGDDEPTATLNDEQLEINRRELQKWGLPLCSDCKNNATVETCDGNLNMKPIFKDRDNCTCITQYECCPKPKDCAKLDETLKCETIRIGVNGKPDSAERYKKKIRDCCTCDKYVCEDCQKKWDIQVAENFTCPNHCDREIDVLDLDKCLLRKCDTKPDPNHKIPTCNTKCQRQINGFDDCGFVLKDCMCLQPPSCRPPEPSKAECQKAVRHDSKEFFQCEKPLNEKIDNNTKCEACWTWTIEIQEPVYTTKKCDDRCQKDKITTLKCGSYDQTCECLEPDNCEPVEPQKIDCHTLEKVYSATTFKCSGDNSLDVCQACFHWKYVADAQKNITDEVCDENCHVQVPTARECGQHKTECKCTGKDKRYCQPEKPKHVNKCYKPVKEMVPMYMCGEAGAEGHCEQCWQWYWQEPDCEDIPLVECNLNCESRVQEHDECGCLTWACRPHSMIPNCEPPKPILNPKICYEEPEINYIYPSVYTAIHESCVRCYNWTAPLKPVVDTFCHDPDALPELCWARWSVKGTCKETVQTCARKNEECVNRFLEDSCPSNFNKLSAWSRCKHERDVCIDCSTLPNEDPPTPLQCYTKEIITIFDTCPLTQYRKKECQYDNIDMHECPNKGQTRRLFRDECNCPVLVCTGCESTTLDVQLVVDSSASVGKRNWEKLVNTLKEDFLPNLMGSRVAFTRFGKDVEIVRTLSESMTTAEDALIDLTFMEDYKNMMLTHTAEAIEEAFEDFNKTARWNDADVNQVLIVLTDGDHTEGQEVEAAAKLWSDRGVRIFAIGIGNIQLSGLKLISQTFVRKLDTFDDLPQEIHEELLPEVCVQTTTKILKNVKR